MSRMHSWFVPALLVALVLLAGGRAAVAGDGESTPFQQAIRSWMGVVAFLAENEGTMHDDDESDHEDQDEDENEDDNGGEQGGDKARRGHGEGRRRHREHVEHGPDASHDHEGQREWRGRQPWHGPRPESPSHQPRVSPRVHHDPQALLGEIVERLSRIERKLDATPRMGSPWSPQPHGSPKRGARWPLPEVARREMDERVRAMMQQGRARMEQAREKMDEARKKFLEMEERIRKLEAEVERMKAAR